MRVRVLVSVDIEAQSLYEGCERVARAMGSVGAVVKSITADEGRELPANVRSIMERGR